MLALVAGTNVFAQPKMKIMKRTAGGQVKEMSDENMLNVPELSAMIMEEGKDLRVDHIMEPEMRMKGYEKTDLKEGDKILMANGKKVGSMKELKEIYNKVATGETVKFGVKREEGTLIASFVKADPKDMPKMKMMIAEGGSGDGSWEGNVDILGIPQVGLVFSNKGNDVIVEAIMPEKSDAIKNADVKEGDVVSTLNTFAVKSFGDFQKRYEKIPAGDKVEIVLSRAGKSETISFTKPKDEGKMIIRRGN
jgi:PDZ domain-containing secreted protein